MLGALSRAALSRPRLTLLLGVALVLLAAAGALRLEIDLSARTFYGSGSGAAAELAEREARWGADDDQLLVVVEGVDLERTADREALAGLAAAVREVPGVGAVTSPIDLPAAAKALAAPQDRVAALFVRLRVGSSDLVRLVPLISRLQDTLGRSGLRGGLSGIPAVHGAFVAQVLRDQLVLGPSVFAAMGLLLAAVFRRLHAVLVAWSLSAFAVLVQVGAMGWLGEPLGLLNQAYFTLTTVIAVSEAVHLVARVHEEVRGAEPGDLGPALSRAAIRAGRGASWALATTAAGFAALGLAPLPVLRGFGLFALPGLFAVWVGVVILAPAALHLSGCAVPPAPRPSIFARVVPALRRHRWLVRGLAIALLVGGGALAWRVPVDNHLSHLLPEDHPVRRAGELVDRTLGGTLSLDVELAAGPGRFHRPAALAELSRLEDRLARTPGVGASLGPGSVARAAGPLDPRAALAGAEALGLPRLVSADGRYARIVLRVPDRGGLAFEELARRVEKVAGEAAPAGIRVAVRSTARSAYAEINRMARALRASLLGALLAVVLAVGLATRSVGLAAAALVPNALPLVLATLGVGALAGTLDPLGAVVLTLALGIGADDTVHLLLRLQEERARGLDVTAALGRAVAHAGRAVGVTTLALAGGLALNVLADFPPLALLGVLGATTLTFAWAADLFILPVMVPGRGLGPPPGSARRAAARRSGPTPPRP